MKVNCSARQDHFDSGIEAVQQVSVYQLGKPYYLIGRWHCCPECFEEVMKELKKRIGGVAVVWPLKRKNKAVEAVNASH